MSTSRKIAIVVGAFFLFSNITFLVGAMVFVEPIIGAQDYLTLVSESRTEIVLGVLLELVNSVAYMGIAVLMYSLLKQRFETLALAYFAFRVLEFVAQILSGFSPLALLGLSEDFVSAGAPQASAFQSLGAVLLDERVWAFQLVSLTFGIGALIFYTMLYQSRLIPRFLSIWGLVGGAVVLVTAVFEMFGVSTTNVDFLGFIMLLNELFLGVWLIVKGFNPSAVTSAKDATKRAQLAYR